MAREDLKYVLEARGRSGKAVLHPDTMVTIMTRSICPLGRRVVHTKEGFTTVSNLVVEALIEIPMGSQNKYEFDKRMGLLRLDRVLYSPVHYPSDYGYIEETLEDDGDPIDILVLVTNPTVPGCVIDTRVVGVLSMRDDKGIDNKLLGVPVRDPRFEQVQDLKDIPGHLLREIEHFFKTYKDLEGKETVIQGWSGADGAAAALALAREAHALRR